MKDIEPISKDRDKILLETRKVIDSYIKTNAPSRKQLEDYKVKAYTEATKKIEAAIMEKFKGKNHSLYNMMAAGSKGNMLQIRQILAAPMLLNDPSGKVISKPVTKSYSEGLPTSEMWIQSYGARKGVMDRSLETSAPGELAKMLISSTMNNVVSIKDCGTHSGITESIDDKNVLDRFSAESVAGVVGYNEIITTIVTDKAKKAGLKTLKVRSPMKCEAQDGVCAKCSGLDENGREYEIGFNIGISSAQTISEPATQLIMKTFHTGGAAGGAGNIVGSFDRLQQLLMMPENLVDKATLASVDGKVVNIKESAIGGSDVYIGSVMHHIPVNYKLKVKIGDDVKAGDALSSGVIKPQELLEYKGIDSVRNYMRDELYDLYKDDGPVKKATIEQIIKTITSLTRVVHPGKSDYISDDIAPVNKINAMNKKLDKNDKIDHKPILKGLITFPTALTSGQDADWMAQMGYRYLLGTMRDAASLGWTSDIHGYHPIPGLVYAQEFGKGKDGKY